MRQGVAAWLHSLAELPAPSTAPRPAPAPVAEEAALIDILLAMASQRLREEAA